MKRIYFLIPNIDMAKKIVNELLLERIDERHMHVLAKRGTAMEDLPEASYLQKSDFIPALEQGLTLGGFTGLISGLVAMAYPGGPMLPGGTILATSLAGAVFGALASSMIGSSVGNRQIKQFSEAIEKGDFLLMIDLPKQRIDEIEKVVKRNHPDAMSRGTEPTIPAFP
ncbi:MAG TPA: DUF1269 domain-containing protein [Gallionellaceae bacterium]|nr:DUF1269 domain-containing protein [Gallionellaceae bacterium]